MAEERSKLNRITDHPGVFAFHLSRNAGPIVETWVMKRLLHRRRNLVLLLLIALVLVTAFMLGLMLGSLLAL